MNILLDPVPTTIEISGSRYEINSDYRISILFEMLLMDPEVPDSQSCTRDSNYTIQPYQTTFRGPLKECCGFTAAVKNWRGKLDLGEDRIPSIRMTTTTRISTLHFWINMGLTCKMWPICIGGSSKHCFRG